MEEGLLLASWEELSLFMDRGAYLSSRSKKPNDTFILNRNAESEDFSARSIVFWQRSYSIYSNEESVATATEYFKDRSST